MDTKNILLPASPFLQNPPIDLPLTQPSSSSLTTVTKQVTCSNSSSIKQVLHLERQNEHPFADGYHVEIPPIHFTVDSSSILEISTNGNLKYPEQILSLAATVYDFSVLQKLKAENTAQYANASAEQIRGLLRGYELIKAHGNRDRVHLLLKIGVILNDLRQTLGREAFAKYQKEMFENKHRRYFEHARQLAQHYYFCFTYAALGKNRLLELLRLLKKENLPDIEFIKAIGFIDITVDEDGELFKIQVDALLTLYRLHAAGISFASIHDAALIASYKKEAMGVNEALNVKKQIDKLSADETGQQKAFENYVKDKLIFKTDDETKSQSPPDLNKLLAELIANCYPEKIRDPKWASFQKELLSEAIFLEAHSLLHIIAEEFSITLQQ